MNRTPLLTLATYCLSFFFFQAEDGIRDATVTGVQTCALPISPARFQGYFEHMELELMTKAGLTPMQALVSATGDAAKFMKLSGKIGTLQPGAWEIGRASCRERVEIGGVAGGVEREEGEWEEQR